MRGRREVPELGPRRDVRTVGADDHAPPRTIALRIPRGVADRVLAREFVRDLTVDAGQLRELVREERPRAGFLRELAQHELRFLESFGRRARTVWRPQADAIDRGFGSLRQI